MLNLIVANGSDQGRVYTLSEGKPHLIGRLNGALSVWISDQSASRIHAELISDANRWIVKDTYSSNGTFVNGRRVSGHTRLHNGDQLRVGNTLFVVDLQADKGSKVTSHVGGSPAQGRVRALRRPDGRQPSPSVRPMSPGVAPSMPILPQGIDPTVNAVVAASGLMIPVGWILMAFTVLTMLALVVDVCRYPY